MTRPDNILIRLTVALLILLCMLVSGCRRDLSKALNSQGSLKAVMYESGEPSFERYIEQSSREFRELVQWAERNSDGWKPNMITVKPGILFEGRDFSLILRPESATFIYGGGQFARPIPTEEYSHFHRLLGGFTVSGF